MDLSLNIVVVTVQWVCEWCGGAESVKAENSIYIFELQRSPPQNSKSGPHATVTAATFVRNDAREYFVKLLLPLSDF